MMTRNPLEHLADVEEISIGFRRPDGSTGSTPVWVVQVDTERPRESRTHAVRLERYAGRMTVRDLLTALQALPRDAELLAFEAGCESSRGVGGWGRLPGDNLAGQCHVLPVATCATGGGQQPIRWR
jgi:hypothetical protein